MSSDESRVHSWGNQQENPAPSSSTQSYNPSSASSDCQEVFTPVPLASFYPQPPSLNPLSNSPRSMEQRRKLREERTREESSSRGGPWGASSLRSVIHEGSLATIRAKYGIPSTVELVMPSSTDRADNPPVGCVALNGAILSAGLRLPFPKIIRSFLSSWGIAPTQLCPNGWRTLVATLILWKQLGYPEMDASTFNSLFTFKEDGKSTGWWYTSARPRTGGSLVLDTPSSVKGWKEEFFYVLGEWQFHPDEVDRGDVVPTLYHPLCK